MAKDEKTGSGGLTSWILAIGTTATLVPRSQLFLHVLPPGMVAGIVLAVIMPSEVDTHWGEFLAWPISLGIGLAVLHWRFMAGHFDDKQ